MNSSYEVLTEQFLLLNVQSLLEIYTRKQHEFYVVYLHYIIAYVDCVQRRVIDGRRFIRADLCSIGPVSATVYVGELSETPLALRRCLQRMCSDLCVLTPLATRCGPDGTARSHAAACAVRARIWDTISTCRSESRCRRTARWKLTARADRNDLYLIFVEHSRTIVFRLSAIKCKNVTAKVKSI